MSETTSGSVLKTGLVWASIALLLGVGAVLLLFPARAEDQAPTPKPAVDDSTIELKSDEVGRFKIKPVEERAFRDERKAVGNIGFNEEMQTDVFPNWPGKVLRVFAHEGDMVTAGAPLYTIDSPDLVQAGSNLIAAAGVMELTSRTLARTREVMDVQGAAQQALDQAISDQQSAEAALKAARDAVRIFGKTDAEVDAIIRDRKIDHELVVACPISGLVIARNASPGLLAQPGNAPAPYTVAEVSTMWMLAEVAESEFGALRGDMPVDVFVSAYPGRPFKGRIVEIGSVVDASSRRFRVKSVIPDPKHELISGMFATFTIGIGESRSPGVPYNGVIREGDGTMSVWVTQDGKKLVRRTVKTGVRQDGFVQVLDNLKSGEQVATDAALFLSNSLVGSPAD